MATHSIILVWRIPWTEEPGEVQSMGHRVRNDLATNTHTHSDTLTYIPTQIHSDVCMHSHTHSDTFSHTCRCIDTLRHTLRCMHTHAHTLRWMHTLRNAHPDTCTDTHSD